MLDDMRARFQQQQQIRERTRFCVPGTGNRLLLVLQHARLGTGQKLAGCQNCPRSGGCKRSKVLLLPQLLSALFILDLERHFASGDPGSKDWMDSPFTGQGTPPVNGTEIFVSAYLDRLLEVNQVDYSHRAVLGILFTWSDPRARAAVAASSNSFNETGDCARPCFNSQRPLPGAKCCDTLWLPTFLIRNIAEYPQGRSQPSHIAIMPNGAVTWRIQLQATFYTRMDMKAFPFDTQGLLVHLQFAQGPSDPKIIITPSSAGTELFNLGRGDDLSGWKVMNVTISISSREYSDQFKTSKTRSNPRDLAPLIPVDGSQHEAVYNPGTMTDVEIIILVKRLSSFFVLSAALPIMVCTSLSFLTFFVQPGKIDTRLQIIVTLFLALVAIQFVLEAELPRASYVLPTRQLVISSYIVLALVAVETLVVFNVAGYDSMMEFFQGLQQARKRRQEMFRETRRAAGLPTDSRRFESVMAQLQASRRGVSRSLLGSFQRRGKGANLPDDGFVHGRTTVSWGPVTSMDLKAKPDAENGLGTPERMGRPPSGAGQLPLPKPSGSPNGAASAHWAGENGNGVGQDGSVTSSLAAGLVTGDTENSAAHVAGDMRKRWHAFAANGKASGHGGGGAKPWRKSCMAGPVLLCEEDRKWYFLWLAWVIDMIACGLAVVMYLVSTILIFYFNG